MKLAGWIFMILSWSFIIGLATFCFRTIFKQGLDGEVSEKTSKKSKNRR
ncbi:MAG: hypothetical protein Q8O30_11965 [Candidatus Omnitrophota bacterium]|nr:hypothetical protein [Candidatus Omnitrophota bacterium]